MPYDFELRSGLMTKPSWTNASWLRRGADASFAVIIVLIVGTMIVPLPPWLLDLLIATNLCLAVLLLLTATFVKEGLSFAAFPTLLLVTTLYRLALNVSSTRLILLQADAGEVIRAFGDFVVRGDYIVGAIIFMILTLIQFVVIARGAERVAEVGARFTLDAMPGKQLSIDADLRAGLIDAEEAGKRRRNLEREGQFYGSMDGAMKFVKGDVIAGIAITFINIVGGLVIGLLNHEMSIDEALQTYGLLTIGDGLVSQIPSLLVSTAAGIVVTRVASEDERNSLGHDIGRQILGDSRALAVAACFALFLALVPGLPTLPFGVLALILGILAFTRGRHRTHDDTPKSKGRNPRTDPIELRTGSRLYETLHPSEAWHVAMEALRDTLYDAYGIRIALVQPESDLRLHPDEYTLSIAARKADGGQIPHKHRFVADSVDALRSLDENIKIDGEGAWLRPEVLTEAYREKATNAVDVLQRRMTQVLHANLAATMGVHEVRLELDRLAKHAPSLVLSVVPEKMDITRLTVLLKNLLAERISIRPLREVLETLAIAQIPSSDRALYHLVRGQLSYLLTEPLLDEHGVLQVHSLDPLIEESIRDTINADGHAFMGPDLAEDIVTAVREVQKTHVPLILLTQADIRIHLRNLLAAELPDVAILSYAEVGDVVQVKRVGMVGP